MKSIDEILPGVVAGIIDRSEQANLKREESQPGRSQAVGSSTLGSLKSMFEENTEISK